MFLKKKIPFSLIEISFYFFPISLILGSLIVNLNILIFLILSYSTFIIDKIRINLNLSSILLFLFFLTVILSSILNIETINVSNFIKSILLLKFFFVYLALEILIKNNKINLDYFFIVCLFLICFVSLDLILQFFYGKNILGYEPWEGRITGLFEHEAIAGAFLQKLFLFSIIGSLLIFNDRGKKSYFFSFFVLLIIFIASFVASNRISFLILFSISIILIIFFSILRSKLIFALIFSIPIFIYLYQSDEQTYIKYSGFVNKVVQLTNISKVSEEKKENLSIDVSSESRTLPNHGKIFLTAFKSFNNNKILGNGLKSFRYECKNYLKQKNTICSTHPHNYHLEVLHDTGLVGFVIITFFVFYLLINKSKLIFSSNISYSEKIFLSLIVINFLIEIFPIKSTGSLFTTWNGTLLWISIALLNYKNYSDAR